MSRMYVFLRKLPAAAFMTLALAGCGDGEDAASPWDTWDDFPWAEATVADLRDKLDGGADPTARDEDGWTPLHLAADRTEASPEVVRLLLDRGADVEARDEYGTTPLHLAVWHLAVWRTSPEVVRVLLEHGADVMARVEEGAWRGLTALHLAAGRAEASPEVVRLLLDRGADVEARNEYGTTPLHLAARSASPELARLLLDRGADLEARNEDGNTALHFAAGRAEASPELARLLLDRGADLEARDEDGNTPLYIAAKEGASPKVVRVLLEHGADVEARDKSGSETLLRYAASNGFPEVVRALLEHGVDIEARDKSGNTPLHDAAARTSPEVVRVLLEHGADVEARDESGNTPLYQAAKADASPEVVRVLLEHGADVEARDKDGDTPLHEAAYGNEDPRVAELLLERGAVLEARNAKGNVPLHYAVAANESLDVTRVLLDRGADLEARDKGGLTALHFAANRAEDSPEVVRLLPEVVRLLLERGADVDARDEDGRTPLYIAAKEGASPKVVRVLLEHGADVDARDEGDQTPLHLAVNAPDSSLDVARLLLDRGANLEVRNEYGNTPLHLAARYSFPEIARLLLDRGANLEARNELGNTPLHRAVAYKVAYNESLEMARLLLDQGADPTARTEYAEEAEGVKEHARGSTPLHLAARYGAPEAVRLLLERGAPLEARDAGGNTPLHLALGDNESLRKVRLLLERGADVEARNHRGFAPLHLVRHANTAAALLEWGASMDARVEGRDLWHKEAGITPVSRQMMGVLLPDAVGKRAEALEKKAEGFWEFMKWHWEDADARLEVIDLLDRCGADLNVRDGRGKTILQYAQDEFSDDPVAFYGYKLLALWPLQLDIYFDKYSDNENCVGVEDAPGGAAGEKFRDCDACPEMAVVPAGEFMMGSPSSEEGRSDSEGPVRRVRIGKFAVGVYEVTFAEWDACVADGGCGGHRPEDEGWGRGWRPVINVSWEDARSYVQWLSAKTGERYRLLSESEWEYAARAGTTTPFHTGRTISTKQANYNVRKTAPVGAYPPNAFGLHDMHGNVSEWVQDCWSENYVGAPSDGSAWEEGDCGRRVLRGGSWSNIPRFLRSANRNRGTTGDRDNRVGFRVARTLTP